MKVCCFSFSGGAENESLLIRFVQSWFFWCMLVGVGYVPFLLQTSKCKKNVIERNSHIITC